MSMVSAVEVALLLRRDPPTAEQQAVIEGPLVPSLVVAGAGSGKTETMAGRVVWLLANGLVGPEQVLGLTFTRKAAAELEQRIRVRVRRLVHAAADAGVDLPGRTRLLDGTGGDHVLAELARPTVSTYNSYAASLVADHALLLGVEPASRLLGEAARYQLAAEVVETWPQDLGLDASLSTVIDAVLALAGALSEHLLTPATAAGRIEQLAARLERTPATGPKGHLKDVTEVLESLRARTRLLDLVAAFQDRKRAAEAIDFGDQVALAARLARQVPQVGAGERARFAVVLLDEYQDTSYAQVELLHALFGGGHPVTAVGDPHQAIYGWRGASAGALARFPATFAALGPDGPRPAEQRHLSVSWRNDHAILAVANRAAAPLRAGSPLDVPLLVGRAGAGPGLVQARIVLDLAAEAAAVADFVVAGRAAVGAGATAAVLCRKRAQFDLLAEELRARGLVVEVVGLGGLLASPEVIDLVAALQVIHDPARGDALMRLLTGSRTRLGAADLHALADWAGQLAGPRRVAEDGDLAPADGVDAASIVDALDQLPPSAWVSRRGRRLSERGRRRLVELAQVLAALRSRTHLALPELVGEAERLLGLDIEVVAARPDLDPATARAQLDAFADVVDEFAGSSDRASLGAFLAWLQAAEERERGFELPVAVPDPRAVQVCTVHAAKGLEWDVVAVPGLVDGVFPATGTTGPGAPKDKGWLTALDTLPYPVRGDRDDLPVLQPDGATTSRELADRFLQLARDNGAHLVAEERRLAYVAFTRAKSRLLLTAARWDTTTKPRALSPFLAELCDEGLVDLLETVDDPGTTNPATAVARTEGWPADPFGLDGAGVARRTAVQAAADAIRTVRAQHPQGPPAVPGDADDELVTLLLAEEAARRAPVREAELPPHLSASALVQLDGDPAAFALDLRRPVPARPSTAARRGTAFHTWVEAFYGRASLVDIDDLPGADDELLGPESEVAALRAAFLTSEWADRAPVAVEVDLETAVAGITLRARIDAVFPDPERSDGVVVVDWKTGTPPRDAAARSSRELQLAVYRLAWSRHTGLALDQVRAAFCYVASGTTVYPDRLLDEHQIADLLAAVTAG
ncbi:MAG: ATP-dependent helicase [Cellulomonas sp.]|nr:ATP-dependent helicase [Cellulomonas sp.]